MNTSFLLFISLCFFLSLSFAAPIATSFAKSCSSDKDCVKAGEYCQKYSCSSSSQGKCVYAENLFCTSDLSPVCACNGKTYNNLCELTKVKQSLSFYGECHKLNPTTARPVVLTPHPKPIPGVPTTSKPVKAHAVNCSYHFDCQPHQFCSKAECGALVGYCVVKGDEMCTLEYNPVCGCNGKTYPNSCYALNAGVNIEKTGACTTEIAVDEEEDDDEDDDEEEEGVVEEVEDNDDAFHIDTDGLLADCSTDSDCANGQFCNKESCSASKGACVLKGDEFCSLDYNPVCGCDGKSYPNVCYAFKAGISVATSGECAISMEPAEPADEEELRQPMKVCRGSSDCQSHEFCNKEFCSDKTGFCASKGAEICSSIYQPVCGCDDKTYSSPCHAYNAGINLQSIGECHNSGDDDEMSNKHDRHNKLTEEEISGAASHIKSMEEAEALEFKKMMEEIARLKEMAERIKNKQNEINSKPNDEENSCTFNVDCEDHEYCRKDSCSDKFGTCTRHQGFGCAEIYDPVCGCNKKTYATSCHAMLAGVNVARKGACPKSPENVTCEGPRHCHANEFCKKDTCSQLTGVCWSKENFICADVHKPVCGCDGLTYNSSCHAHKKNVNVAYNGQCRFNSNNNGNGTCSDTKDCGAGKWCHKPTCTGIGKCLNIIQAKCATVYDPVCGCNGVSYTNSCQAGNALASIKHKGECAKNT